MELEGLIYKIKKELKDELKKEILEELGLCNKVNNIFEDIPDLSKEDLNKNLKYYMNNSYNTSIVENGLIGAKYVTITEERTCRECNCTILKKSISLAASTRDSLRRKAITYLCIKCGNKQLNKLKELNQGLAELLVEDFSFGGF